MISNVDYFEVVSPQVCNNASLGTCPQIKLILLPKYQRKSWIKTKKIWAQGWCNLGWYH